MLGVDQVGLLLGKLGLSGRHEVAEDLLHIVDGLVPMAQCTIFSFEEGKAPRTIAVGDRSRTSSLPAISQAYATHYHPYDGLQAVMQAERAHAQSATAAHPHIVMHRQRPGDIQHEGYRVACYEVPQVAERLAILALYQGWRWLSVHFYRGVEHGPLSGADVQTLEALAPLVVHAVRLHHTGQLFDEDLQEWLLARLHRRCPDLTKRDLDVLRGLLAGQDNTTLAAQLGLTVGSTQTYVKRVQRKLGVDSVRALMGLALAGEGEGPQHL